MLHAWNYLQKHAQNVAPSLEQMMNFLGMANFTNQEKKRGKTTWVISVTAVVFTSSIAHYFISRFSDIVCNHVEQESMNWTNSFV